MKKILTAVSLAAMLAACGNADKHNFKITGSLDGSDIESGDTVRLYDAYDRDRTVVAEAVVGDDLSFTMTGNTELPLFGAVVVDGQRIAYAALEGEDIDMTYDPDKTDIIVTGSYTNENLDKYDDEILAVYGELNGVETEEQAEEVIGRMKKIMENAVAENSDRLLGAVMLYNYYAQFAEPDEIARMIDTLAPDMQKNKGVEQLKKLCANARNGEIGATLADVRLTATDGREIAVSEIIAEGKWVLVDFWATWCGPCRGEIPYLVEAYKKYADKGFEIYGITLDRPGSEQQWKKFVEDNGMTYVNVWGYTGNSCPAAELYNVRSIPTNFLFSPEGVLVARDLRGEDIETTLAEHIK